MRPINGSPLSPATSTAGYWWEPKLGGMRVILNVPTGEVWNRHGQKLTHKDSFAPALEKLRIALLPTGIEWADCEGLLIAHEWGKGTVILLDAFNDFSTPIEERRATLVGLLPLFPMVKAGEIPTNEAFLIPQYDDTDVPNLWAEVKELADLPNVPKHPLYEGLVAKQKGSVYRFNPRDPKIETPAWRKHRWS